MTRACICLLAMHTLICVTFSLPPGVGVGGWPRLLLVALPGLFCLPFSGEIIAFMIASIWRILSPKGWVSAIPEISKLI